MNLKKPSECSSLEEVRNQIDKIDEEIIRLLGQRHKYVEKVVHFKKDEEGVIAAARKDFVIQQRADWAVQSGADPETIRNLYTILIDRNIEHELKLLRKKIKS